MGKNIKNKIMGVITQISLTNNVICRCLEDWQSRTLGRTLLSGCDASALPTTVLSNHWSPPILFTVYIHITITAPSCLLPFGPQSDSILHAHKKSTSNSSLLLFSSLCLISPTKSSIISFYTLAAVMIIRTRVGTNHMLQNISTTCPKHHTGLNPHKLETQILGFLAVCTKAPAKESKK